MMIYDFALRKAVKSYTIFHLVLTVAVNSSLRSPSLSSFMTQKLLHFRNKLQQKYNKLADYEASLISRLLLFMGENHDVIYCRSHALTSNSAHAAAVVAITMNRSAMRKVHTHTHF
jgi:hypothetical protein